MTFSPEEQAIRSTDNAQARATILPLWFERGVEPRVEEARKELLQEQQRHLAEGEISVEERAEAAARSVEALKQKHDESRTLEQKNRYRLARAAEIFVALGIKGKAAGTRANEPYRPGWFGRIMEVALPFEDEDIKQGTDVIAFIAAGGKEYRLAIDVTYSTLKLDEKFERVKKEIRKGMGPLIHDTQGKKMPALRLIVGLSDTPLRANLMEWGREEQPVEAYDAGVFGTRIREQVLSQLQQFETYALECGKTNLHARILAQQYREVREALERWLPKPPKVVGLENDPVHQGILSRAKAIASSR